MRSYDKEFKINAVNVYKKSGRGIGTIAEELSIPKATFSKWVRLFDEEGLDSFPGKGKVRNSEEELQALRKELHHVTQERDILKNRLKTKPFPEG